ncbi:dihydrolipoyl dehydrogenase family protein, partial [Thermodesulfobacteriota bacterium]
MAEYDFDIGVIGGGAAGLTVSAGSSQFGAKTLLVEKEKILGGDCLHYGCVPSKTLIKSAKVYHLLKNTLKYGLPEIKVPPVEYSKIGERIKSVIDTIQKHDSEDRFCSLGVQVVYGLPSFLDSHTIELEGKRYSAKKWVIATGSSPAIPKLNGLETIPFITNKEIYSLSELPEEIIILGAGPIAVEMAQAFCRLGSKVIVIQRSGQILSKEDKDMADTVMDILASEGVEFYLNSSVLNVNRIGNEVEITIKNKDGEESKLKAEKLLVAMGRSPNLDGLKLEKAGVEYDKKGVKVDSRLRTSRKHIYAAGDVTGKYQFTHAAGYEGSIVISNAIFHLPRKTDYAFLPWCTYTDPELASIGLNEKRAGDAGIKYSVWTEEFKNNDRSLAEGEESGRIKMILDEKEKPIGVQILGQNGGDL